jgi:hypothetical protein
MIFRRFIHLEHAAYPAAGMCEQVWAGLEPFGPIRLAVSSAEPATPDAGPCRRLGRELFPVPPSVGG